MNLKPRRTLLQAVLGLLAAVTPLMSASITTRPNTAHAALPQQATQPKQAAAPIANLLKPDGALDLTTGFNGSLDPKGWEMQTAPNGEPIFVQSSTSTGQSSNENSELKTQDSKLETPPPMAPTTPTPNPDNRWDAKFGYSDLNGTVYAIAVNGSDVYVGGAFTTVGSMTANRIVKWNSGQWSTLGSGLNGAVYAISVVGTNIYVGGNFNATADGAVTLRYIAKWSGSAWSEVLGGMNANVRALYLLNNYIYAGGDFTLAGSTVVHHIARISQSSGAQWQALLDVGTGVEGVGVVGAVYALANRGGNIVVGGTFRSAGGDDARNIAIWSTDAGGDWSTFDNGVRQGISGNGVYSLGYFGNFTYAGHDNDSEGNISKWDNVNDQWLELDGGLNGTVRTMIQVEGEIYAGGDFDDLGPGSSGSYNHIARWTGFSWQPLGSSSTNGANDDVRTMAAIGDTIFAGGLFTQTVGVNSGRMAHWNVTNEVWSPMNSGANSTIVAIAIMDSNVYVGGDFTQIGSIPARRVAKWNGSQWSAVGGGFNDTVRALAVSGGYLYAGGDFSLSPLRPGYIAKLNDYDDWVGLGYGVNNPVYAIAAASHGNLFVGGTFTTAGGASANRLAKWNGSAWSALGSGANNGVNATVYALATSGSTLYVGGNFTTAGPLPANRVARFNSSSNQWSAMGAAGMNSSVRALAVSGSTVYAGGNFTTAGGNNANYLAQWNGDAWSVVGQGYGALSGAVYALAATNGKLYIGGSFTTASGIPANRIIKWTGTDWAPLGSGVSATVSAITAVPQSFGADIYVGGYFSLAGNKSSNRFALYNDNQ